MLVGSTLGGMVQINMSIKPKVLCFGRFYDDIPGGIPGSTYSLINNNDLSVLAREYLKMDESALIIIHPGG